LINQIKQWSKNLDPYYIILTSATPQQNKQWKFIIKNCQLTPDDFPYKFYNELIFQDHDTTTPLLLAKENNLSCKICLAIISNITQEKRDQLDIDLSFALTENIVSSKIIKFIPLIKKAQYPMLTNCLQIMKKDNLKYLNMFFL